MERWNNSSRVGGTMLMGILLFWMACATESSLSPKAYVNWLEDPAHGLRIEKKIGDLEFQFQYKTPEYIVAQEERKDNLSSTFVEERKEELGTALDYYNFRIAPASGAKNILMNSARDEQEYFEMIDYFSYAAQEDFYLLNGSDTAQCILYQFVRNYELAPHLEFSLAFENKGPGDQTIIFEDHVLRTGTVKAKIEQQKINRIPKLKTN